MMLAMGGFEYETPLRAIFFAGGDALNRVREEVTGFSLEPLHGCTAVFSDMASAAPDSNRMPSANDQVYEI